MRERVMRLKSSLKVGAAVKEGRSLSDVAKGPKGLAGLSTMSKAVVDVGL